MSASSSATKMWPGAGRRMTPRPTRTSSPVRSASRGPREHARPASRRHLRPRECSQLDLAVFHCLLGRSRGQRDEDERRPLAIRRVGVVRRVDVIATCTAVVKGCGQYRRDRRGSASTSTGYDLPRSRTTCALKLLLPPFIQRIHASSPLHGTGRNLPRHDSRLCKERMMSPSITPSADLPMLSG